MESIIFYFNCFIERTYNYPGNSVCTNDDVLYEKCYWLSNGKRTWDGANQFCNSLGGNSTLATVYNQQQNDHFTQILNR